MDVTNLIRSVAEEFGVESNKDSQLRSVVRMRPVIRSVQRKHVIPYVLSIAEKHIFNLASDSVSTISLFTSVWMQLMQRLKNDKKDSFDFNVVQSLSMECLRSAVELCMDVDASPTMSSTHHTWSSLGLCIDAVSVINRRRRQEDRWFATSDLFSYAAACVNDENEYSKPRSAPFPPVSAVAVFDGHNGPEAAEHCSHLAPYLLSLGLSKHMSSQTPSVTDLLASLFYELNKSVNEGHTNNKWSSGTTATMCVIHGDCISTAWVGDSRAWLVFMPETREIRSESGGQTAKFRNSEPPHYEESTVPKFTRSKSEQLNGDAIRSLRMTKGSSRESSSPRITSTDFTDQGLALTDTVHRPEFANEFVSVLRIGGVVSTVVSSDDGCIPVTTTTYTSAAARPPQRAIYNDIVVPSPAKQAFQLPPLNHPDLSDCRVGGLSCVSRAIGDDYILNGVSGLPSITIWKHKKESKKQPLCLIVASDGLWDTENCSPSDVVALAQQWYRDHLDATENVEKGFSRELTQLAISNGASDNITCVVVWLNQWKPEVWWSHDQLTQSKNVRWPRSTRVTSLVDFNSPNQSLVRGPTYPVPSILEQRSSMYAGTAFEKGIRYSSPPRYKT